MLRDIITIDEDKCDGCGECIPACHEGALQIIDGKCRLISSLFCDGLGACIGECSKGALKIIKAEAEEYNEVEVIKSLLEKPQSVLKAHLAHLSEHNAVDYLNQATDFLSSIGIKVSYNNNVSKPTQSCPGNTMKELKQYVPIKEINDMSDSQLSHWPVQLHLVSSFSPFLKDKELVVLSTCSPVAYANVQKEYIEGNAVVIACPKLDYTEPYPKKLEEIFKNAETKKVVVVRMEVPCCSGISGITVKAATNSNVEGLEVHEHVISIDGRKISEKIIYINHKN